MSKFNLKSLEGFNPKQLKNIEKIIKKLDLIDMNHYSSGGGCWHIMFLLGNYTILEFHNEDGISMSKKEYLNLNDAYNDEDFMNTGWLPDVDIKENYSNPSKIIKAIKGDLIYAY
jgi:hypothetical protein